MTTLALIPARGGSKGVPRKNLREVGGRSLLARAVMAGREATGVDHVFVSTDDVEIRQVAIALGAEAPVLRPAELASDTAPTLPALQHAVSVVEASGIAVTTIVLLEPTSPFRTAHHVTEAVMRFREGECRSVVTVMPLGRRPENIFVKDRTLRRYIRSPVERFARRQDMAHLCRINGAVYVVGRGDLMDGALMPEPIGFVNMDERSSLNIDTLLDLDIADFVARRDGI